MLVTQRCLGAAAQGAGLVAKQLIKAQGLFVAVEKGQSWGVTFHHRIGNPLCSLHCPRPKAPHSRDGEMRRAATHPVRACTSKMQPENMGATSQGLSMGKRPHCQCCVLL